MIVRLQREMLRLLGHKITKSQCQRLHCYRATDISVVETRFCIAAKQTC
jgi:hypothetical protein